MAEATHKLHIIGGSYKQTRVRYTLRGSREGQYQ